jgi:uncharacterized protein YdeI (YjbR/CyaY-like superfamily)
MSDLEFISFSNVNIFHDWLQKNYEKSPGIWMIFYKKHTKIACITYEEALDESLCFGWIDSIIKKIDSTKYARKFTPRKGIKNWSPINKRKVIELIKSGRMNEAGLKKIDSYLESGKIDWGNEITIKKPKNEIALPDHILKEFARDEQALSNFKKLSKTNQHQYILWIMNARRAETIRNRIEESVELLKKNQKLGLR